MAIYIKGVKYIPGTYAKRKPDAFALVNYYTSEWDKKKTLLKKQENLPTKLSPSICFSRKRGTGALEVADILSEQTGFKVVDREIIEHMAGTAELQDKTVTFFDERYPGKLKEFAAFLFGEKSFVMHDYVKHLFQTVLSIADVGSTIFVGRGAHLIIPRDRVLSVRLLSSREYRVERLAGILNLEYKDVDHQLDDIDKEQAVFFKKVFKKKDATPYEFDLCINCDYIKDPKSVADIVYHAFNIKFGSELKQGG